MNKYCGYHSTSLLVNLNSWLPGTESDHGRRFEGNAQAPSHQQQPTDTTNAVLEVSQTQALNNVP